jgi:hypothetical protein
MTNYQIVTTRLKGQQVAIVCTGDGTGFATRADLLARNFGRYSGRYCGYICSAKRAALFEDMLKHGWTGGILGGLYPPEWFKLGSWLKLGSFDTVRHAEWFHKNYTLKGEKRKK